MATLLAEPTMSTRRPTMTDAWRAVAERDGRYDGQFVYAVKSTHIYCRPSCPSRRPSRENVSFFTTPADAEREGYRACKRCDPRAERGDTAIQKARAYLDAAGERSVSLTELAAHAGVSASHLQRSFKRIVGVSPKAYQHARRVEQFKARLRAGDTVSRATYEAGFGSSSRVYENTDAMLGMTPAAFRRGGAGVRIHYTIADARRACAGGDHRSGRVRRDVGRHERRGEARARRGLSERHDRAQRRRTRRLGARRARAHS